MTNILGQNWELPRRISRTEFTALQVGAAVVGAKLDAGQPQPPLKATEEEGRLYRTRVALMEIAAPPHVLPTAMTLARSNRASSRLDCSLNSVSSTIRVATRLTPVGSNTIRRACSPAFKSGCEKPSMTTITPAVFRSPMSPLHPVAPAIPSPSRPQCALVPIVLNYPSIRLGSSKIQTGNRHLTMLLWARKGHSAESSRTRPQLDGN